MRGLAREREDVGHCVRLLADMHIAPRTVVFLRSLGHDVVRVSDVLFRPCIGRDDRRTGRPRAARRADSGSRFLGDHRAQRQDVTDPVRSSGRYPSIAHGCSHGTSARRLAQRFPLPLCLSRDRTAPAGSASSQRRSRNRLRGVDQEAQCSVDRLRVRENIREFGLDQHEVGAGSSLAAVLAPNPAFQLREVVFRSQVVTHSSWRCLLHAVCAPLISREDVHASLTFLSGRLSPPQVRWSGPPGDSAATRNRSPGPPCPS